MDSNPDQIRLSQAVTGHYICSWRVPKSIEVQQHASLDLAVLRFHIERNGGVSYRYATNGFSRHVSHADTAYRSEFYIATAVECPSAISFLVAVCDYALQAKGGVAPYDTMPVTGSPGAEFPSYAGLLIAPPEPLDPESLGQVEVPLQEPVFVSHVVGLNQAQLNFAITEGGEAAWSLIASHGVRYFDGAPDPTL